MVSEARESGKSKLIALIPDITIVDRANRSFIHHNIMIESN